MPARNKQTNKQIHAVGKVQRLLVLNQVVGLYVANTTLQKGSTSSTHVTITSRRNIIGFLYVNIRMEAEMTNAADNTQY